MIGALLSSGLSKHSESSSRIWIKRPRGESSKTDRASSVAEGLDQADPAETEDSEEDGASGERQWIRDANGKRVRRGEQGEGRETWRTAMRTGMRVNRRI